MEINEITQTIIGCAMRVHTALGPGLLESAYHRCLVHELEKRGLLVESEVSLPIAYDGLNIDGAYRVDLRVEGVNVVHLREGIKRFIR